MILQKKFKLWTYLEGVYIKMIWQIVMLWYHISAINQSLYECSELRYILPKDRMIEIWFQPFSELMILYIICNVSNHSYMSQFPQIEVIDWMGFQVTTLTKHMELRPRSPPRLRPDQLFQCLKTKARENNIIFLLARIHCHASNLASLSCPCMVGYLFKVYCCHT